MKSSRHPVIWALTLALVGCFKEPDPASNADSGGGSTGSETNASTTDSGAGSGDSGTSTSGTSDSSTSDSSTSDSSTSDSSTAPSTESSTASDAMTDTTAADDTDSTTSETDPATAGTTETAGSTGEEADCDDFLGSIIYVNIDGATLTKGLADNAPSDITVNETHLGTWGPYSNADIDQVMAVVREHWAPYDVCLTTKRPTALDYSMLVFQSATHNNDPNFPGTSAPPDCSNEEGNNVEVAIASDEANLPVTSKAIIVSKFIARGFFGLESVADANADLMNTPIANTLNGATFTDVCHDKFAASTCATGPTCAVDQQKAHSYLLDVIGPA